MVDKNAFPVDWEVDVLGNCVRIETGSKNTEDKIDNGRYPFFVRSQKVEHIDTYHYDCEAVLTAGDGVGTGKVFHYYNGKFDVHQRVYVLSEFDKVIGRFLYYYFKMNFLKEVEKYTAKSSVDSVRRDMISKMQIPIPGRKEQEAITKILSNVDNLITSLQKLIDKKKSIKQGAMQELLTGKKWLPGYSGEWVEHIIGDILSIGHGQLQHNIEKEFGPYPILATGGCIGYTDKFLWNEPSVLIGRKGTINKPQYIETPFWTIDTLFYSKIRKEYIAKFIYYKFCMIDWLRYNEASGVPSLSANIIENIKIMVPDNKKEQAEIAEILTDMDNEIEQLEKNLLNISKSGRE